MVAPIRIDDHHNDRIVDAAGFVSNQQQVLNLNP
jgi:hypothetical protein